MCIVSFKVSSLANKGPWSAMIELYKEPWAKFILLEPP